MLDSKGPAHIDVINSEFYHAGKCIKVGKIIKGNHNLPRFKDFICDPPIMYIKIKGSRFYGTYTGTMRGK